MSKLELSTMYTFLFKSIEQKYFTKRIFISLKYTFTQINLYKLLLLIFDSKHYSKEQNSISRLMEGFMFKWSENSSWQYACTCLTEMKRTKLRFYGANVVFPPSTRVWLPQHEHEATTADPSYWSTWIRTSLLSDCATWVALRRPCHDACRRSNALA